MSKSPDHYFVYFIKDFVIMHGFRFFDKGTIESTNHCDDSKFTHITIRKGDIISTRMCDIIVIIIKVLENI